MAIVIKEVPLKADQYVAERTQKDTIYLHHTAGAHQPENVVTGWNTDTQGRVATSYLIGGIASDGNALWDGVIVRCFPDEYWASHLGGNLPSALNKKSIGIEICNWGQLTESGGKFLNAYGKEVPQSQVVKLDKPFRGFQYYHKYTDKQIESLRGLLLDIGQRYGINLKAGIQKYIKNEGLKIPAGLAGVDLQKWLNSKGYFGKDGKPLKEDGDIGANTRFAMSCVGIPAFETNSEALNGFPGIWTHTNVRESGKWDCSPQANLIAMLKAL